MKTMIADLTANEILMCEKWETVKKYNIRTDDLEYCYKLLYGKGLENNCPDCLRNYASQVNNYFNTIRDKYNEYKENKNKPADVVKEPVVEKKPVVPKPKPKTTQSKKTSKSTTPKTRKKVVKKDDNINTI